MINKKGFFFSLKWKIAVLIGGVFILLHSAFSYLVYLDVTEDFVLNRENIHSRYRNIAYALTNDSFLVLDQFADLFSVIEEQEQNNTEIHIVSTLDKNWQHWHFIWGLESVVFFNQTGGLVKQWGGLLVPELSSVMDVLKNEAPDHQILCPDSCFQFVMIPVMANSELIGVFGVSRSYADTVIEYNLATGSDIGVLVADKQSLPTNWPYKISAITHAEDNKDILQLMAQDYLLSDFLDQRKVVADNGQSFEISVFPVKAEEEGTAPFFLVIDDISDELATVNTNLQLVWLYGVVSLMLSLALLLVVLFFSLRRVIKLSDALPLLAQHRYDNFRKILTDKTKLSIGHDELDLLNHTALTLTDQLEDLEKELKVNVFKLLEQGQELITERNFIQQLIDVAPILVITQDNNGIILSINQTGIDEFSMEESLITGCVFDNFIPETEAKHLAQLKLLRTGENGQQIKIDGVLEVKPSAQIRHISWIHSIVRPKDDQKSLIILSLGVDINERKKIEEQMLQKGDSRSANQDK